MITIHTELVKAQRSEDELMKRLSEVSRDPQNADVQRQQGMHTLSQAHFPEVTNSPHSPRLRTRSEPPTSPSVSLK